MAEKKYYWLKMTDQFFEDKAIKKLIIAQEDREQ